jgi:endoglucanase
VQNADVRLGGKATGLLAALSLAIPLLGAAPPAGAAPAPPNVVRTGGPSAPGDAKIAVVGSSTNRAGQPFTVVTATKPRVVFTGTLQAAPNPAPWKYAALADFSALTAQGQYKVVVGGKRSAVWEIRAGASRLPIPTLLRFFNANRDGSEPSLEHTAAHLHDAVIASGPAAGQAKNLTGGWMDAGDMLHFTETTGYTAVALQVAALLDPTDAVSLRAEADVGVRWLVKAHPAPGLFIGQVGDERDHGNGWRRPQSDDASTLPGIGTRLAYPSTDSSLAGKAAAAIALAADRATGAARTALVTNAEEWYAAGAATAGAGPTLRGGFYVDDSWKDDLALAAVMLFRATGTASYLTDASTYLAGAGADTQGLAWYDTTALAGADLCGALGRPAAADLTLRALGCQKLAAAATATIDIAASNAPWGNPGYYGWGHTGAQSGGGAAIAIARRAGVIGPTPVAGRARDYLLGANQWGSSFVVGYGPKSPKHPHHWANLDGISRPVGAVVGGPAPRSETTEQGFAVNGKFDTADAVYQDKLKNYVTSEPALDYTVNSLLLLAALPA